METVKNAINGIANDPALFKEARYEVVPSLPMNLGSISLGYSNGEPKIYVTKMVGQEGCIDWNISKLLSTCKNACVNRQFTPELSSMFQGVTNELMPGFAYDMATFHWFLRPHAQDTKIGFALYGSRAFNLLAMKGDNSLAAGNLPFLSQNLRGMVPGSSFVFRRWTSNVDVGEVMADIFVMIGTTSRIFVQVCFKFLFHPTALNRNLINGITSNVSSSASKQASRVVDTDLKETDDDHSPDLPEEAGNGVDHGNNHQSNGTLDEKGTKLRKNTDDIHDIGSSKIGTEDLLKRPVFGGSYGLEWLTQNKFSMYSITAAGLALSMASRGISRDLRIKL